MPLSLSSCPSTLSTGRLYRQRRERRFLTHTWTVVNPSLRLGPEGPQTKGSGMPDPHDLFDSAPPLEDEPAVLEEIEIEELAIDGICGVY